MKRLLKKVAGYDFSYDNVNKILDAMKWTGDGDQNEHTVYFSGTISVETLKSQFGLTDEDINRMPSVIKNSEAVDFDDFVEDMFRDYADHPIDSSDYKFIDKEINVNILNGEFYIEGSATVQYDEEEEMNGPTEFNQKDFL